MTDANPADDVLAQAACADADAFAQLYRRHVQRVYSYALSRTGNIQDAQDVTTQTFIAALEHIDSYEPRGKFAAWLLGIARHKIADEYRRRAPTVSLEQLAPVATDDALPEVQAMQSLTLAAVREALVHLNPERAEALRLRIFGELTMREVGAVLGKSEGAAKMLVHRALEDLRRFFNVGSVENATTHQTKETAS